MKDRNLRLLYGFAVVGKVNIDEYMKKQGDDIVLDAKMKRYLSTIRTYLEKIEKTFDYKSVNVKTLLKKGLDDFFSWYKGEGESISVLEEDATLLGVLGMIKIRFEGALKNAKNLSKQIKTYIKYVISYITKYEEYIANGCR